MGETPNNKYDGMTVTETESVAHHFLWEWLQNGLNLETELDEYGNITHLVFVHADGTEAEDEFYWLQETGYIECGHFEDECGGWVDTVTPKGLDLMNSDPKPFMEGIKNKVVVGHLEGAVLDWAVAKSVLKTPQISPIYEDGTETGEYAILCNEERYSPSTIWEQGGPLIEEYEVSVVWHGYHRKWCANIWGSKSIDHFDSALLVAAMRAIVSEKLGNVIDSPPEELTKWLITPTK